MTYRERMERRAERLREWAGKQRAKASASFEAARTDEAKTGIPFGQPVLIGHHSARRHIRVLERAEAAGMRGLAHYRKAEDQASRASGIELQLERAIFSDDPDAVEALEAKLAGLEAERDAIKALNAKCRKGDEAAIAKAREVCRHTADDPRRGFPAYKLRNLGGEITRCRKRIEEVKRRQAKTAAAEAAPNGVLLIARPGYGGKMYCSVTFAEKPERAIIDALRPKFTWGAGSWSGELADLPEVVRDLVAEQMPENGIER